MTCGPERRDPIPDAELMLSLPAEDWKNLFRACRKHIPAFSGNTIPIVMLERQLARQLDAMAKLPKAP